MDAPCLQAKLLFEVMRRLRPGAPLRCLHGKMKQMKRMAIFYEFGQVDPAWHPMSGIHFAGGSRHGGMRGSCSFTGHAPPGMCVPYFRSTCP